MEIKSTRKYVRNAPDKIRILSSMIKNKGYEYAVSQLEFCGKQAAKPLILTLKQALDQAKDKNMGVEKLTIKEIRVDEGPKLKRRLILHQGRSSMLLKRMAHISIILTDDQKISEARNPKKIAKVQNSKVKEPIAKVAKGASDES